MNLENIIFSLLFCGMCELCVKDKFVEVSFFEYFIIDKIRVIGKR